MSESIDAKASRINHMLRDVDGVLTDGRVLRAQGRWQALTQANLAEGQQA